MNRILLWCAMALAGLMFASPALAEPGYFGANAERGLIRVTTSPGDELFPSVSPDASRLVFITQREDNPTGRLNWDVFMISTHEGHPATLITNNVSDDLFPSFTPDSRDILFCSNRDGAVHLWEIGANGIGGNLSLVRSRANDFMPDMSRDGRRVAFASSHRGFTQWLSSGSCVCNAKSYPSYDRDKPFIYTMYRDGSDLTEMVEGLCPKWSPDGRYIVFSSKMTGNFDIWLMGADGSNLAQLTTGESDEIEPCFSPDGQWITFSSNAAGNWDIWSIRVDGSNLTQLTSSPACDGAPTWGTDGRIYFHSNRSGNYDIWAMDEYRCTGMALPVVNYRPGRFPMVQPANMVHMPPLGTLPPAATSYGVPSGMAGMGSGPMGIGADPTGIGSMAAQGDGGLPRVGVLNSTSVNRAAAKCVMALEHNLRGATIVVTQVDNAATERNLNTSKIYYRADAVGSATAIELAIPGKQSMVASDMADYPGLDVAVVVGNQLAHALR